jgi:hypothetical protein
MPLPLSVCTIACVVGGIICLAMARRVRGASRAMLGLIGSLCLTMAAVCGSAMLCLRTYAQLTMETPVARVQCARFSHAPTHFVVYYTQLAPYAQPTQRFDMTGEQWMVSGDMLTWHPWLNVLGLRTVHKPTRLSGRFIRADDEERHPHTAHALNGGTDAWWLWLYRHHAQLPGIAACMATASTLSPTPAAPTPSMPPPPATSSNDAARFFRPQDIDTKAKQAP